MKNRIKHFIIYLIITVLSFSSVSPYTAYVYAADKAPESVEEDQTDNTITPVSDIPEEDLPEIKHEHDESSVIAKLAGKIPLSELNEALKAADSVLPTTITEADIAMNYICLKTATGVSVEQAMVQLEQLPQIQSTHPNYIYHQPEAPLSPTLTSAGVSLSLASVTNDPYSMSSFFNHWMLSAIDAFDAWDIQKTENKITVAVIDSLTDLNHEDLKSNIVDYYDVTGLGWDSSTDQTNHGTHVSGIISARADNGVGCVGVSYNASLFPIRVTDPIGNASVFNILRGFQCVLDNKDKYSIRVINLSMTVNILNDTDYDSLVTDSYVEVLNECIDSLYNAGIITVIASGNFAVEAEGPYPAYPTDWCGTAVGVIALAGKDGSGVPAESEINKLARLNLSNYNRPGERTKNISAPGNSILSCGNDSIYGYLSGTSMATPCVSGVLSLILAYNPGLSPTQAKDILYSSAKDLGSSGWDEVYGYGCVNAKNAMEYAAAGLYFDNSTYEAMAGSSFTLTPKRAGSYSWTSSDPSIANVDNGVVNAKKTGVVAITATGNDGKAISREIAVLSMPFSQPSSIEVGESISVNCNTSPTQGYTWFYSIADPTIVSLENEYIDYKGESIKDINKIKLTGLKAGSTTIIATSGGIRQTFPVNVTANGIINAKITGVKQKTYTGSPLTQKPTVKMGKKKLKENHDYILSYEDNINTGTATMIITGIGNYHGSKRVTFNIKPKSASGAKVTGVGAKVYSGDSILQDPTVKIGGNVLAPGSDYTLSFKKNINAGSATMTIAFMGNYKGKKNVSFKIKKAANPLVVSGKDVGVKSSELADTYKAIPAAEFMEFQNSGIGKIRYSKKSGNGKISVNSQTGVLKVSKGLAPGSYTIYIKVTTAGNKNYNKKTLTIPVNVTIT